MDSSDSTLIISLELMQDVVAGMTRDGRDVMEEAMQLLDLSNANDSVGSSSYGKGKNNNDNNSASMGIPKLTYDRMKRRFALPNVHGGIFGTVDDKVDMLLERYALIHQRLMRQENFRPKLVSSLEGGIQQGEGNDAVKITPIEGLLGSSGEKILLGIIVQVEEGRYYLEDPTAQVPMDLSAGEFLSDGFITEHSICLVEGEMVDGILVVHKIGQPIYESRKEAIAAIGLANSDLFGAIPTLSELSKLREEEVKHGEDGLFVLLSDVHLDDTRVLEKLEKLFEGFKGFDPLPVFIFMGDFASKYPSAVEKNANATIMGYFDDLANVILKFPKVAKEGKFIIVPGQNDPGIGSIMPRPQIPNFFTTSLRSKVKHVHMASNPCRLRFFSKEFVIGRLDVMSKFRRDCLVSPQNNVNDENIDNNPKKDADLELKDERMEEKKGQEEDDEKDANPLVHHAIKTMLDQGHMCPVPSSSLPIYWKYDHLMRLYPPPDAIVLGDKSTGRYYETYMDDCDVMNPGAFYADGGFLVFRPIDMYSGEMKSDVEFSQID